MMYTITIQTPYAKQSIMDYTGKKPRVKYFRTKGEAQCYVDYAVRSYKRVFEEEVTYTITEYDPLQH